MIINCKNKIPKTRLANIPKGECFIDDDGDLMMKIETIGDYNCIDVSTGNAYEYDEDFEVIPVKSWVEYSY
jgi:hypothetical protein